MDTNLNSSSFDVPPSKKASAVGSSLSNSNAVSAQAYISTPVVPGENVARKHIIRKIIPLDPNKLKQAGLNRKIAEALSKQKSQQNINSTKKNVDSLPSTSSQIKTVATKNVITVSKAIQLPQPAHGIDFKGNMNKMKPPKITVTGPDELTEQEKQNLANLNPQQRLVHVKYLLNKKIQQKKSKETNDNTKTNQILQTPQAIGDNYQRNLSAKVNIEKSTTKYIYDASKNSVKLINPPQPLIDQSQTKLPMRPAKEAAVMKSAAEKPINVQTPQKKTKTTKSLTPQKSPQDIARKLVFQTQIPAQTSHYETKLIITENKNSATHPDDVEFLSCLNKNKYMAEIPKASITSVNTPPQHRTPKQHIKKSERVGAELSAKQSFTIVKKTGSPQSFQGAYVKRQKISTEPCKAAISTVITEMKSKKSEKLIFPEVSPLKIFFPTVNIPKETPLPAIDSFKPHFPSSGTTCYDFQAKITQQNDCILTNYETSLLSQQPTASNNQNNQNKTASATNCLVVLENKILSQDEMIDLTELRLSTKTPRFIHPHRPIPEVVIKQENPDDYQTTDGSLTKCFTHKTQQPKNNVKLPIKNLVNFNKQQKIIINSQKLKMPPEQLADLARRIKETTTKTKQVANKYQGSKVSNKKSPLKNPSPILSHPPEMPQNFILPKNEMFNNTINYHQDHSYYDGHNFVIASQTNDEIFNNTTPIETNSTKSSAEPQLYNSYYKNSRDTNANINTTENSLGSIDYSKSVVEIIDEPLETEDCFSAVDFIAAMAGANAELSPEELNFSASCAVNLNCTPVKKSIISPSTSPQTFQSNVSENLRKSTIVIESSKGQETILTNESPDKNDLEKVKEKIKIYHEMNKQKLANYEVKYKNSSKKIQHIQCENNSRMRCLPVVDAINYGTNDSNLKDNTNACDMVIEEPNYKQSFYLLQGREDQSKNKIIEIPCPKRQEGTSSTSLINKIPPTTKKIENSALITNAKDFCKNIATPLEQYIKQNLETQNQSEEHSVKKSDELTPEILPFKSFNNETSETINTKIKLQSVTEILKGNETISNTGTASKRISKFKKGKINLVARNKPLAAARNKTDECSKANINDEQNTEEKKTEYKKKIYLEPRNTSLDERNEDKVTDSQTQEAKEGNEEVEKSQIEALERSKKEILPTEFVDSENAVSKLTKHFNKHKEDEEAETTKNKMPEEENQKEEHPERQTPEKETTEMGKITQSLSDTKTQNNQIVFKTAAVNKIKTMLTTLAKTSKSISLKVTPNISKTTESLKIQTETVETVEICQPANIVEEIQSSQDVEKHSREESKEDKERQDIQSLQTTQPFAVELASKLSDEVNEKLLQNLRHSLESINIQNSMEGKETQLKSSKTHEIKKTFPNRLDPQTLPKGTTTGMKELSQHKESKETESYQVTDNLKLTDNDSATMEKQGDSTISVVEAGEDQKVSGLSKDLMGRIQVLPDLKEIINNEITNMETFETQKSKYLRSFDETLLKKLDNTKIVQPKLCLAKAALNVCMTKQLNEVKYPKTKNLQQDERQSKTPKIKITEMTESLAEYCEQKSKKMEYLNPQSQAVLQTMKSAKVSLIDIVKHSPTLPSHKSSILPFRKTPSTNKNKNVCGVLTLLKQLGGQENDSGAKEKMPQTKKTERESRKSLLEKEEENTSKCFQRSYSRAKKTETPPLPPQITKKRFSLRPLISDDDLEFLPENAEIKFKLTTSKQKEENKKSKPEILKTKDAQNTRENLYSSDSRKRKRFYSQTLEANVTVTFDNLKAKTNHPKTKQHLANQESGQDSTQDSNFVTPIKKRKKFIKTMEDIKKFQNAPSDSDSEDSHRDSDCLVGDCEESTEFLGFEETPTRSTSNATASLDATNEARHESKTKHGGLENWLTTGKAISPTFHNPTSRQRSLLDNESSNVSKSSCIRTIIPVTKQEIPLKKRWDLCSKSAYEETDITDDTSPADDTSLADEDEDIPLNKIFKHDINTLIDSNKSTSETKKIKLGDNSFIEKGRKAKTNQNTTAAKKKSSAIPQQQETPNNLERNFDDKSKSRTRTSKKKTTIKKDASAKDMPTSEDKQEHVASAAEISFSTPKNLTTNKRKRGRSKQNAHLETPTSAFDSNLCDSSVNVGPSCSFKKSHLNVFEDLDSNSLLTALETSNISHERISNMEELDSNSLLTPLETSNISHERISYVEELAGNSIITTSLVKKSNRGKYSRPTSYVSNFNSRLLLITKRDQLDSEEILTETKSGSGSVQCGLCLTHTQSTKWVGHLAQHYGVGWQVGKQRLNIENRTVVLNTISNYMKNAKSTPLACRMCKKVLRSALGILTHIEQCGNTERVKCDFCKKDYCKNSLITHLRTCQVRIVLQNQNSAKESPNEKSEVASAVVGNSGRLKRHSTIKAETKLKVLGKELDTLADTEKSQMDPKLHIKYVPPSELDLTDKWSKEIENAGQAACPKARCRFTSTNLNELSVHLKQCKHTKCGYICNFCRKSFKTEKEAIEHITAKHQKGRLRRKSDDSDCSVKTDFEPSSDDAELPEDVDETASLESFCAEEEDCDEETSNKKSKSKSKNAKSRFRNPLNDNRSAVFGGRFRDLNNDIAKKWNSFKKVNHSCAPLFNEFQPMYSVLNHSDYEKYLPAQTVSMKFTFTTNTKLNATVGLPQKDIEWSELNRFETINNKMHTYFFLGAPIKLCIWLPLPDNVKEQYLAVVYRQDMFKFIKFNQPKQHHSIVLLFKVTQQNKVPELSILYGLMVDGGPIHHLTFLPSGGYNPSSNRLGLMAVATVTSCIRVFSLPLNVDMARKREKSESSNSKENITLIGIKPSFLLNLDIAQQNDEEKQQQDLINPQCIQICWSEFSGHQHVVAGFTNGFVGIWNIINKPEQNLNLFVIDNTINYAPVNYFFLGEKCAKCIALHYDTLGPRWLAVSTAYRKLIVFDIKNLMNPIVLKEETLKNILLSLDWCPIWETFLFSYDDALPNPGSGVLALNPTNVMFQHTKVDSSTSGVTQVHYTPVTNMCVTALTNGDIAFLNTKELHYENCLSRKTFDRRAFYALDVIKLNGEPLVRLPKKTKQTDNVEITKDWVMHDCHYKENYGLIFTPLLKLEEKFRKAYLSEERIPPSNVIPIMRVNSVRCNINQQTKHLVAAGYENGFLRLLNFNKDKVFS